MEKTPNIVKGIGITAVVVGHSCCPNFLHDIIYAFHMPLFFILSGYLFKEKYFSQRKTFLKKRVHTLYLPYVVWSISFILLHNTFFRLGLINDIYGYNGKVNHIYSYTETGFQIVKSFFLIQNENFLGAFWFIRSLLIGQILFLFLFNSTKKQILGIPIIIILLITRILMIKYNVIPDAGTILHQALFATLFISIGALLKKHPIRTHSVKNIFPFSILILSGLYFNLSMDSNITNIVILPITGFCGYLLINKISILIEQKKIGTFFSIIGNQSFYIFALHFLMFKPISLLKIHLYNLDPEMLGAFPVITEYNTFFWILYSITGIILSFVLSFVIEKIPILNRRKISIK